MVEKLNLEWVSWAQFDWQYEKNHNLEPAELFPSVPQ